MLVRRFAVLAVAVGSMIAVPGSALAANPTCAFANQSPCIAKHSRVFHFWGKAPDVSPTDTSLTLTFGGFDEKPALANALSNYVDDTASIYFTKTARYFSVNEHGVRSRVSPATFFGVLDAYDRATVYLTATLYATDTFDTDTARFHATVATVDISDLTEGPDLSGTWKVNGSYGVELTSQSSNNTLYQGVSTSGDGVTFTLTVVSPTTVCISDYNYPGNPAANATFGCGPISANQQKLGAIAWTSPVWGAGTWSFAH